MEDSKTYTLTLQFDPRTFKLHMGGDSYSPDMSISILEQALREVKFTANLQRMQQAQQEAILQARAQGLIHKS